MTSTTMDREDSARITAEAMAHTQDCHENYSAWIEDGDVEIALSEELEACRAHAVSVSAFAQAGLVSKCSLHTQMADYHYYRIKYLAEYVRGIPTQQEDARILTRQAHHDTGSAFRKYDQKAAKKAIEKLVSRCETEYIKAKGRQRTLKGVRPSGFMRGMREAINILEGMMQE